MASHMRQPGNPQRHPTQHNASAGSAGQRRPSAQSPQGAQQRAAQRAPQRTPQPSKGRSAAPVVAVLLVVVCAVLFFTLALPRLFGAQSAGSSKGSNQQVHIDGQEAAQASDEQQSPVSDSSSLTEQTSGNDDRAAEFAVDPTRTNWNFEAPATKTVYLTFDDGPSENTQKVLDVLDKYGIKATFFVTGMHPDYFNMIKKCYDKGHTIGLHTYSHEYDQVYASVDAYWNDLNQIGETVRQQIGYVPCFIRFPGGSSNTISANYTQGIMTALSQQVVDAGYQYFDWDASCGDGADHTADELVDATMADTSYGYKSIVFLMHDGTAKETTAEALPRIIEYFKSEGYEFAPIDRNTCVPHHGIGN